MARMECGAGQRAGSLFARREPEQAGKDRMVGVRLLTGREKSHKYKKEKVEGILLCDL